MTRVAAVVLLALAALPLPMGAQSADRIDRVAGIRGDAVAMFFQRLRSAVGTDDKARACGMIAYPLAHESGAVADAAACEARYDSLFTLDVRKAIGKQAFDELFVNDRGLMVGTGEVWISGRCAAPPCALADIRIISINSNAASLTPPQGKVLLACYATRQLIHVEADGANGASFRLWRSANAGDTPTVNIAKATESLRDGTCGAREWTFADGTTRYTIGDLPCDAHEAPPPMGSVGQLVVARAGQPDVRVWCEE